MSMKLGWFAIQASREEAVAALSAATKDAPSDAVPSSFGIDSFGDWTSFSIPGWELGHVFHWAQAVGFHASAQRPSPVTTVAFFVLEGTWSWSVHSGGEHIAAMESFPHPHPVLLGDLERAALLLSVPSSLLRAYCVGYPFGDVDEESASDEELDRIDDAMASLEDFRVNNDDEFPPWDEYGYVDFARHIGVNEPMGEEVKLPQSPPGGAWSLPRLDVHKDTTYAFDPVDWRARHLDA